MAGAQRVLPVGHGLVLHGVLHALERERADVLVQQVPKVGLAEEQRCVRGQRSLHNLERKHRRHRRRETGEPLRRLAGREVA